MKWFKTKEILPGDALSVLVYLDGSILHCNYECADERIKAFYLRLTDIAVIVNASYWTVAFDCIRYLDNDYSAYFNEDYNQEECLSWFDTRVVEPPSDFDGDKGDEDKKEKEKYESLKILMYFTHDNENETLSGEMVEGYHNARGFYYLSTYGNKQFVKPDYWIYSEYLTKYLPKDTDENKK